MSQIVFQSPSGSCEVWGGEREHLRQVASAPGLAALELADRGTYAVEQAEMILSMAAAGDDPDNPDRYAYLHDLMAEARTERVANSVMWSGHPGGPPYPVTSYEKQMSVVAAVRTALKVGGLALTAAGVHFHTDDAIMNAALAAGSDVVRLAALIHGLCESHMWVAGEDRAWLASLIREGVDTGIYRERFLGGPVPDTYGTRRVVEVGWLKLAGWLRERDDEPVVLSYTVSDSFPSWEIAGQPHLEDLPQDWRPDGWAEQEWAEQDDSYRSEIRAGHQRDIWAEQPAELRWEQSLAGLRAVRPWTHVTPANIADRRFHIGVTIYDMIAYDRDARVRAAYKATYGRDQP